MVLVVGGSAPFGGHGEVKLSRVYIFVAEKSLNKVSRDVVFEKVSGEGMT